MNGGNIADFGLMDCSYLYKLEEVVETHLSLGKWAGVTVPKEFLRTDCQLK